MDPLERAVAKAILDQDLIQQDARKDTVKPKAPTYSPEPVEAPNESETAKPEADQTVKVMSETMLPEAAMTKSRIVAHMSEGIGVNVITMLRTQILQRMKRHSAKSLAIVGPHEGVGKSWVATNLAMSIARLGSEPVVLLDFDLRAPTIARVLGFEPTAGSADYLSGECQIENLCHRTQFDGFFVCPGGGSGVNAAELLASLSSRQIFDELRSMLGDPFIIVDLPPILGAPDAHSVLPYCDAALVVVEYARTSPANIEEMVRLLGSTPLVGSVVNKGNLVNEFSYGYGINSDLNV